MSGVPDWVSNALSLDGEFLFDTIKGLTRHQVEMMIYFICSYRDENTPVKVDWSPDVMSTDLWTSATDLFNSCDEGAKRTMHGWQYTWVTLKFKVNSKVEDNRRRQLARGNIPLVPMHVLEVQLASLLDLNVKFCLPWCEPEWSQDLTEEDDNASNEEYNNDSDSVQQSPETSRTRAEVLVDIQYHLQRISNGIGELLQIFKELK